MLVGWEGLQDLYWCVLVGGAVLKTIIGPSRGLSVYFFVPFLATIYCSSDLEDHPSSLFKTSFKRLSTCLLRCLFSDIFFPFLVL